MWWSNSFEGQLLGVRQSGTGVLPSLKLRQHLGIQLRVILALIVWSQWPTLIKQTTDGQHPMTSLYLRNGLSSLDQILHGDGECHSETYYTVPGKKGATLYSTITLALLGRLLAERYNFNTVIHNARVRFDSVRANPEWTSWKLMPPASSGTPEQLRLAHFGLTILHTTCKALCQSRLQHCEFESCVSVLFLCNCPFS